MQFLTLLVSIASLSAYTLAGVHAQCVSCPSKVSNQPSSGRCQDKSGGTHCLYGGAQSNPVKLHCYYDNKGKLSSASANTNCPSKLAPGNACAKC
ncbi:hypothetical protein BDN67DRAFT_228853 [Paxillus ammoniavirescens]|nr:hypothetical protein BDN67DRAFT_228853 [Paxillus ammoniavirescens]